MNPENRRAALDGSEPRIPPSRASAYRTALALARVGTRRCRLAAALVAVVVGLASQIGSQAVAQAKQPVLYLDAPAVSAERASRAGEAADSYATPGSPASPEVLAWLEVPTRPVDSSPPAEDAREAFASITAPDGEEGGVTPSAALLAGQVMLAQLEAPPSEEENGDADLASADAVRPQLGDGTGAPEAEPEVADPDGPQEQPGDAGPTPDAGAPAYASTPRAVVPSEEPSGGPGVVVPDPLPADEEVPDDVPEQAPPAELASVPADTGVAQIPDAGSSGEVYGPTGPVSDTGQIPMAPAAGSPEDGDAEVEQPYPEESFPVEESETGGVELAGSEPTTELTVEDTGPTSGDGSEIALMPGSPLAAEEEPTTAEGNSETVEDPAPPGDAGGEMAYVEPLPSEETLEEPSGTDAPKDIATEPPADEPGEERVEIVVVSGEMLPTETPAGAPSEQSSAEQPPSEEPLVEQPPAGEEAPVEQPPGDAPSDEEQPRAEERSPSADVPGARDAASQTSTEGRQTGGERHEDPKDTTLPPGSELPGAPRPDDRVPANPQEAGRDEQQGKDPQRNPGPRGDEARPTTGLAGQVGENDGGGEAARGRVQGPAGATEGGGPSQKEQTVIVGTELSSGGAGVPDLPPEPLARTGPPATEESIAAEQVPRAAHAPARVTAEKLTAQQAVVEQVRRRRVAAPAVEREQAAAKRYVPEQLAPAPQPTPDSAPATAYRSAVAPTSERTVADRATAPEAAGGSPAGGSEQPGELSGTARTSRGTPVDQKKTQPRGGN